MWPLKPTAVHWASQDGDHHISQGWSGIQTAVYFKHLGQASSVHRTYFCKWTLCILSSVPQSTEDESFLLPQLGLYLKLWRCMPSDLGISSLVPEVLAKKVPRRGAMDKSTGMLKSSLNLKPKYPQQLNSILGSWEHVWSGPRRSLHPNFWCWAIYIL